MKDAIKKNIFLLIGTGLGAGAGFLYWHQIGCSSGTCTITSSPTIRTIYGAVMGGLLLSTFKKTKKE